MTPAGRRADAAGRRHQVFPPRQPPALGAWVPTVKGAHPMRVVTATPDGEVHYTSDGERHECRASSFWSWRSRVNAVHREVELVQF